MSQMDPSQQPAQPNQFQPLAKPRLRTPKNREYSKPQQMRAIVLNEAGGTVTEIAAELGLDEKIIKKMLAGKSIIDPSDIEAAKGEFTKDLVGLLYKILKVANKDEFVKRLAEKGKDLGVLMGITVDKLQLLTGKPTQITETNTVLAEAEKKLAELVEFEKLLVATLPKNTKEN